jgi:hypothetical protein
MTEPVSEERQQAYFDRARKGVESFVAERLVAYDETTRTTTLTDAGRRFIAP